MSAKLIGALKKTAWVILIFLCAAFVIRAWESQRRIAPLQPWHTYVPTELSPKAMDASDWNGYLRHEAQLFKDVDARMAAELDDSMRVATNRYNPDAPPVLEQERIASALRQEMLRMAVIRQDDAVKEDS